MFQWKTVAGQRRWGTKWRGGSIDEAENGTTSAGFIEWKAGASNGVSLFNPHVLYYRIAEWAVATDPRPLAWIEQSRTTKYEGANDDEVIRVVA